MRPYMETRAEERNRLATEKQLRAALRKAGIRVSRVQHEPRMYWEGRS